MATDYISREAAIEAIKSECAGCVGQEIGEQFCSKCAIRMREVTMYSVPTADVVEVVRCGKCKYYIENMGMCVFDAEYDNGEWYGFVSHHAEDYFCADGERRTDDA